MYHTHNQDLDQVFEKINAKIEDNEITNTELVDYDPISDNCAKVVLGCPQKLTLHAIRSGVYNIFSHQLIPLNPTCKIHNDTNSYYNYGSIIVNRYPKILREVEKARHMVQISSASFLDQKLDNIWSKEIIDGVPYFSRDQEESIDEIIEANMTAMVSNVRSGYDPRRIKPIFRPGDTVKVFTVKDEKQYGINCKVLAAYDSHVTVKYRGSEMNVPYGSIMAKIENAENTKDVVSYLEKAWIPKAGNYNPAFKTALKSIG
jgi:hypothetical protein